MVIAALSQIRKLLDLVAGTCTYDQSFSRGDVQLGLGGAQIDYSTSKVLIRAEK
jgi:hypothetical protein